MIRFNIKYLLAIISIFRGVNSFAQVTKSTPTPIISLDPGINRFGRVSSISLSARVKKYPFNKTFQVQLVSFEDPTGGGQRDTTKKIVYNANMPKSNMAVCINPFKEIKST